MKQGVIIYYFRPCCMNCNWEAPRIYHRGEEDLANEAFDHHECPMPQILAMDRFKPLPMPAITKLSSLTSPTLHDAERDKIVKGFRNKMTRGCVP